MIALRFSVRRAIHLLSASLEAVVAVALFAKLVVVIVWLQPHHEFLRPTVDAVCDILLLSILAFAAVAICRVVTSWRRGLFVLLRAIIYFGIAGLIPSSLGPNGSNQSLEPTAGRCTKKVEGREIVDSIAKLAAASGGSARSR